MQKRILIPTDYSKNAFNAIVYAFKLFENEACVFHIFHSYFLSRSAQGNLLFPEPEPHEYDEAARASGESMIRLKNKVEQFADNPKHTLYFDHKFGTLIELLKEKVLQENINLIVMGTRGITDDIKVAYGRNSVNVMENIGACAVLAVPANVLYKQINEIVFPSNFKSHFNTREIDIFVKIAQLEKSPIRILHIGKEANLSEKQRNNRKEIEGYFEGLEYTYHWLEDTGVKEGVLSFVDERNSGMIAFVNRKHWFFGSIFSNPLVKSLGIHSKVPIFALHDSRN
ncbi:universal stress protein [Aequorivita sp. F47161]|uniref:Universal stress protein n=1 Tax=Aequorivita vitellina TaxID=2874475 RepID=A0A9X1QZD2_9FLAO|nr:universal stress protein [Aequorivita vitellina]MCG2420147.1 universal stress protein [Aequorivita vitellina]